MSNLRKFAKGLYLALAAFMVMVPNGVSFADRWEQEVLDRLQQVERQFGRDGYRKTHDFFTAKIRPEQSESYSVTLDGGRDYTIVSVCDSDCDNVDLRLLDIDGGLIETDIELNEFPQIATSPSNTMRYQVEVVIPGCRESRCTIGIGIFGR